MEFRFQKVARVAADGDNVAVASRRLEAGARITADRQTWTLSHTVLEGHRFATGEIPEGGPLRSWGLPFGHATRRVAPGEYLCNRRILDVLSERRVDLERPDAPNFLDYASPFRLDPDAVRVCDQIPPSARQRVFAGFARGAERGVGTRNYIVVLGTSSLAGTYARTLADRFRRVEGERHNIDGVVAAAHTEGGEGRPNNLDFILRALSGFIVHPNVGAVLIVDVGDEAVNNGELQGFMRAHGYPLASVAHRFMSLGGTPLQESLEQGVSIVASWLDPVDAVGRSAQPAEHLTIALQCGGSDAFSGISANPLAGWVAAQTIRHGGSANLAETDELMGAEPYVLSRVRDLDTARAFLDRIESFRHRAGLHGHNAEGNPSGGNLFRGLYNITIKSIGAARKKDPQVRLDHVIDYGQRMDTGGFYFMDSPGNDLESIAGQVASGANLIVFTTGNGSVTNFPFVPTLKFVSTTGRYDLVRTEMDVNAGQFQDGRQLDDLGDETFELALRTASGRRTAGERAGHSQVQLWRDWRQTKRGAHVAVAKAAAPRGRPLAIRPSPVRQAAFDAYRTATGFAVDQVGMVMPTSLCSGEVARLIVDRLNRERLHPHAVSRYVTLAHTEGCGVSSGDSENLFLRTAVGYVTHPMVRRGLFLEHGCEKTHNDGMRRVLESLALDPSRYGWASIQLDGGIDRVSDKVASWFDEALRGEAALASEPVSLGKLRLGLTAFGAVPDPAAGAAARLAAAVVTAGGLVVVPRNAGLLESPAFLAPLLESPVETTLAYGGTAEGGGFHVMDSPTRHAAETLAGLGATGVDLILAHCTAHPVQAHPLIPLLQVASDASVPDMDATLNTRLDSTHDATLNPRAGVASLCDEMLELVLRVASRKYTPTLYGRGYTDFQITRGLLGVSL